MVFTSYNIAEVEFTNMNFVPSTPYTELIAPVVRPVESFTISSAATKSAGGTNKNTKDIATTINLVFILSEIKSPR